jgi:hypothetical protein
MLYSQLAFPVAVWHPGGLAGGSGAGLGSPARFPLDLGGVARWEGYQDVTILDSHGREFAVEGVRFVRPSLFRGLCDMARQLRRLDAPAPFALRPVDIELRERSRHDLPAFLALLERAALAHPIWWRRHASEAAMRRLFDGCSTHAEAIERIGILAPSGPRWPCPEADRPP